LYQHIQYQVTDPVAIITMNRPDQLNALTTRMLAEIRHAIGAAERDTSVVGIILTGAGRGFCAGMDMTSLDGMAAGDSQAEDLSELKTEVGDPALGENFQVTYSFLMSVRKPIVSAINGPCAGLGFVIAMLTDMRFVERQAKFTTAFSQRGLIAEHGVSWILPRLIGPGRALDILWSARKFTGEEAQQLGIAERLCETGAAVTDATAYIEQLAATTSPKSLQLMKAQVYRHLNMQLGEAATESNEWMSESLRQDEFKEGVRSFLERRPPNFKRVDVE
jgi:enoyl-CoA hydratase/carnithine racemase